MQLIPVFPSVPHSRAALATQTRRVPNPNGHLYEVTCRAEACVTVSDPFRPPNCIGLYAAHRFRSILCTLDAFPSDQGRFRVSLNLGNHFECIKGIFGPLTCRCCIGSALAHHLKTQRLTTPYYHEAQCSSPFMFHSMLHLCAALVT